jgi:hypothetical protein
METPDETYHIDLGDKLNKIFSYYGRTKWLILDRKGQLSSGAHFWLVHHGWRSVAGTENWCVFESPVILDHAAEIEKVCKMIAKEKSTCDGVEIVASFGAIPAVNIDKAPSV